MEKINKNHIIITASNEIIELLNDTFLDLDNISSQEELAQLVDWILNTISRVFVKTVDTFSSTLEDKIFILDNAYENIKENLYNLHDPSR